MTVRIITGDCRDVLATLPAESVHCCVTSPPYWGLRDYGVAGQIGLESTYQDFVEQMVAVFREVRRVLRADGTLWLNLGDSYASGEIGRHDGGRTYGDTYDRKSFGERQQRRPSGLKPKDLCGIPWRVAFALQADGWWLRQDIIWSKPNPMPESVTDRCTKAHEYVFLLSKSERYYYDAEAIKEAAFAENEHDLTGPGMFAPGQTSQRGNRRRTGKSGDYGNGAGRKDGDRYPSGGWTEGATRNRRSVWEVDEDEFEQFIAWKAAQRVRGSVWPIATQPFKQAHFATFPPALIEPCILAGCPKGGTVLDPFFGAGTTGLVADRLRRHCIGIELNPAYADMARKRIIGDAPLFVAAE
jgi:DNA modification methylase